MEDRYASPTRGTLRDGSRRRGVDLGGDRRELARPLGPVEKRLRYTYGRAW